VSTGGTASLADSEISENCATKEITRQIIPLSHVLDGPDAGVLLIGGRRSRSELFESIWRQRRFALFIKAIVFLAKCWCDRNISTRVGNVSRNIHDVATKFAYPEFFLVENIVVGYPAPNVKVRALLHRQQCGDRNNHFAACDGSLWAEHKRNILLVSKVNEVKSKEAVRIPWAKNCNAYENASWVCPHCCSR
jgi:hypothetical protein